MNNFEANRPLVVGFGGGGSTGNTTAGFIEAVEAGLVDGVNKVEAFAFVGTADSGSRTGDLRSFYGIPAPGDIRRSTSALSANRGAAAAFERRFTADDTPSMVDEHTEELLSLLSQTESRVSADRAAQIMTNTLSLSQDVFDRDPKRLKGYALGHLVLTALTLEHGNIDTATQEAGRLMVVRGEVIPVSIVPHGLVMRDGNEIVRGEHNIDARTIKHPDDVEVSLDRFVPLNPRLERAIDSADKLVIGPGSVYTSIVPALLPVGMEKSLQRMKAEGRTLTLIGNLVTQETETHGWTGERYVTETERYTGRPVDEVIYNQDTDGLTDAVVFDRELLAQMGDYQVVSTNLVKAGDITRDPEDPLANERAEVVHDTRAMAVALVGGQTAVRNSTELVSA